MIKLVIRLGNPYEFSNLFDINNLNTATIKFTCTYSLCLSRRNYFQSPVSVIRLESGGKIRRRSD